MADTKTSKPFHKTFIGNLLIIIALCIALYWIFFGALSIFTRHNDVRIVPSLKGMTLDSAMNIITKEGFDVKIDSVFDKEFGLNEIIDQQPSSGEKVKTGRIIFLTVNKANPPLIVLPNLVGLTLRAAQLELKKSGLELGDTLYVFDLAEGTIIEQRFKGLVVSSGIKIPEGSVIDITISKGLSDELVSIPNLQGVTMPEALKMLNEKDLRYRISFDGGISDTNTALVFYQYPESRNEYGEPLRVYKGDKIEFKVGQNPTIEKKTYAVRPAAEKPSVDDNIVGNTESKGSGTTGPTTDQKDPKSESANTKPKQEKKPAYVLPPTYPTDKKDPVKEADPTKERPKRPNR